jgi:membrane-associated phospholipid phosphatase
MNQLKDPLAIMDKPKARPFSFYVQQQDWFLWVLIVLAGVATYVVDKKVPNYERKFVVSDSTIAYVHNEDTIAFWLAPLIPAVVFIAHMAYWELTKTHLPLGHRISSIFRFFTSCLAALAVVGFHTELFKTLCGRLRPDFLDRCYDTDGNVAEGTETKCLQNGREYDGRKSFPSGHSSCTLAISMFAAYYVLWCLHFRVGKLGNKGYHNKMYMDGSSCAKRLLMEFLSFLDLLLMLFQLAWAWGVGISRFRDNRHHPSDIIGGFVLAMTFTPLFLLRTISQQAYWDQFIMDADRKDEGNGLPLNASGRPDPSKYDLEAPMPHHQHNHSDSNSTYTQFAKPAIPQHSHQHHHQLPHQQQQHQQQQQYHQEQLPLPQVPQASWAPVPGSVALAEDSHAVQLASVQPARESCFAPAQPSLSSTYSTVPLMPSGAESSDSMAPATAATSSMGSGAGRGSSADAASNSAAGAQEGGGGRLAVMTQHMSLAKPEKQHVEKLASA